jgi:hypothetical protein
MSATFAITWTLIAIGSMVACYRIGWREGVRDEREKQSRRDEFWDEES